MANNNRIAILAGDGIGPEIMAAAETVLDAIERRYRLSLQRSYAEVGGVAIDRQGTALPEATVTICRQSNAILFGAVGGPQWESLPSDQQPERAALLPLRKMFDLFANLRPAIVFPQLVAASPLRPDIIGDGLDVLIVRELTSGIYFGHPKHHDQERGLDTLLYTRTEIERIAHVAFAIARQRRGSVTSIDKANVLSSMVLWREVVSRIGAEYPDVPLGHLYVDNAAMQIIANPRQFDVMLCGNMFGDILSDAASMVTGSLGLLPSASLSLLSNTGAFGLYEPAGGTAPDIAGRDIANPIAQILSLAMLLKYSLAIDEAYTVIFQAVRAVLEEGYRTADIMSAGCSLVGTNDMGHRIAEKVADISVEK